MSIIIAFFTALLGIPASLGIGFNEPECRTTEFTTLMYHHIREYSEGDDAAKNISVSPAEFEEQMRYLHNNKYTAITSRNIREKTVPCKSVMITFDDGYYDILTQAYPLMKQYNYVGVIGLILAKIDQSDYLFGPDIRNLQKSGWEIASHTWNHPNLSELPDEFITHEIDQSKKDLEKWFDTTVHIFVYPKGRYRYKTLEQIKTSGYTYAFTTQSGKTDLTQSPLELKRIDVIPGMNIDQFAQTLESITSPIHER